MTKHEKAAITLHLGPCRVTYYGNPALKWRVFGFIGRVWIDVPFMSRDDALAFGKDHGWTIVYV
jgi:hypothetical protein